MNIYDLTNFRWYPTIRGKHYVAMLYMYVEIRCTPVVVLYIMEYYMSTCSI